MLRTLICSRGPTQPGSWLLHAQNLTYRKGGDADCTPKRTRDSMVTLQVAHAREEALKWKGGTEREEAEMDAARQASLEDNVPART